MNRQTSQTAAKATAAYIKLDQFLKWVNAVETGGHAKQLIKEGLVTVNGATEERRGRKLYQGDKVTYQGQSWTVEATQL